MARRWLHQQHFDEAALTATFNLYLATLTVREAAVDAIEAELIRWVDRAPFATAAHRLGAYRGITQLGGLILGAEVFDWRRFPTAAMFMAFSRSWLQ